MKSIYTRLRERNLCNHRDFQVCDVTVVCPCDATEVWALVFALQNIGVNGGRTTSMQPPGKAWLRGRGALADWCSSFCIACVGIINALQRNPKADQPLLVFYALIGNDVCNGHPGLGSMTTVRASASCSPLRVFLSCVIASSLCHCAARLCVLCVTWICIRHSSAAACGVPSGGYQVHAVPGHCAALRLLRAVHRLGGWPCVVEHDARCAASCVAMVCVRLALVIVAFLRLLCGVDKIHPLGVPYPALYEWLSCSGSNPCWGWLNANETWRNLTTQRATQLNAVYGNVRAPDVHVPLRVTQSPASAPPCASLSSVHRS